MKHVFDIVLFIRYFDKLSELCRRISEWAMGASLGSGRDLTGVSRSKSQV